MELKRKKLQGVKNILSFNRHFYVVGLIVLGIFNLCLFLLNASLIIQYTITIVFFIGLLMPLIISAYVYDFSGFYEFKWLKHIKLESKNVVLNINAGFDETSYILNRKLKPKSFRVYDFYDKYKHTEPAIKRARRLGLVYPNTKFVNSQKIQLEDNSVDAIFFISALHEIRQSEERIQFLKECKRVCKTNAKVVLVEHLRDLPNFLAFSIGFTHFFSKNTWVSDFNKAGFTLDNSLKFTRFMSILTFKK